MNERSVAVSTVSVTDWNEIADQSLDSSYDADTRYLTWAEAKQVDGVYAIDQVGRPVAYEDATAESYTGVAFVVNGHAYRIANRDIPGYVYWWMTGAEDIADLRNFLYSYETRPYAYVPKTDGTYGGAINKIDTDWNTWINSTWIEASFTDFNGKADILVERLGNIAYTIGKSVVDFRSNEFLNEGYTDWFVPSCAQMACIAILAGKIEAILAKVSNASIFDHTDQTDYWTSTEKSASDAWYVGFFDGGVGPGPKSNDRPKRCRLIREL